MASPLPPVHCAHAETWPLERFRPHPDNPNTHPKAQIALLADVIGKVGWRAPIVVSKQSGFVVKGHGRLAAAHLAGWASAPVDLQDYPDPAAELADLIADNRLASLSEFSLPGLGAALAKVREAGLDLQMAGFTVKALEKLVLPGFSVAINPREVSTITLPWGLTFQGRITRRNGIAWASLANYAGEKEVLDAIKANGKNWPAETVETLVLAIVQLLTELGLVFDVVTAPPAHHPGHHAASHLAGKVGERLGILGLTLFAAELTRAGHHPGRAMERENAIAPTDEQRAHAGRRVLLVDDVATSGLTMEIALRTLRAAGCHAFGLVIVRLAPHG